MSKIKIILVDDHKLFRDGLASIFENQQHIQIEGAYGDALSAFESLSEKDIDIVITDITMEPTNGIELCRRITNHYQCVKVIILSMHDNEEFIMEAMSAGAKAYLPKDIAGKELVEAIENVFEGKEYLNQRIGQTILKALLKKNEIPENKELSKRELEVLKLVADGLMNKQVADHLNISIRTVDCHKNNIMTKLEINSTAELVKYAIKNNIVHL